MSELEFARSEEGTSLDVATALLKELHRELGTLPTPAVRVFAELSEALGEARSAGGAASPSASPPLPSPVGLPGLLPHLAARPGVLVR